MSRLPNIFYAQSGGMTAVINATAAAVALTARNHPERIGKVYAGENGIMGALEEAMVDLSRESDAALNALRYTPGGAFGSSRFALGTPASHPQHYARIIDVFRAHNIRWFLYNGGGGSAGTSMHIANAARQAGYPLAVIHLPKTVDNDLAQTDFSPGFGSVAKYTAVSTQEAALDVASMCRTSTQVFVMEVMGRHAGWIAASSALAQQDGTGAPHIILFPEIAFDETRFLAAVERAVASDGYCVVVTAEGLAVNNPMVDTESVIATTGHGKDKLNVHTGKAAPYLAALVGQRLGFRCHFAVSDYLQRSARHIASAVDVEAAWRVGETAIDMALAGADQVMVSLQRKGVRKVSWGVVPVPLPKVIGKEVCLPRNFIRRDGFGITDACRNYLLPLIQGEDYPPYHQGLPKPAMLKKIAVKKKLPLFLMP
ncbi:MAG TPA: 6-phosphofructokinase [Moraxellaceae bacterium]|nr:6-phosphofructokinase [Moraxellaceae bacterium]